MKTLFVLIIYTLSCTCEARLFLDVLIESKKGIDRELTLGSELHVTKEVFSTRPMILRLKSGLEITLKTKFDDNFLENEWGPIDRVIVAGDVKGDNGETIPSLFSRPVAIQLGKERVLSQVLKSEKIEIKITPYIK